MLREHIAEKGLGVSEAEALLFTAPGGGLPALLELGPSKLVPGGGGCRRGADGRGRERGPGPVRGLSFHELRRAANATGLVAEGVDVKTAQTTLGHSEARLTLDVYAQAVAKLGEAAAEAMGARFLAPPPRDGRAMPSDAGGEPA
jgi:integrase